MGEAGGGQWKARLMAMMLHVPRTVRKEQTRPLPDGVEPKAFMEAELLPCLLL